MMNMLSFYRFSRTSRLFSKKFRRNLQDYILPLLNIYYIMSYDEVYFCIRSLIEYKIINRADNRVFAKKLFLSQKTILYRKKLHFFAIKSLFCKKVQFCKKLYFIAKPDIFPKKYTFLRQSTRNAIMIQHFTYSFQKPNVKFCMMKQKQSTAGAVD